MTYEPLPSMKHHYTPSQRKCCKCGTDILADHGWCTRCRELLKMIPNTTCITCERPVDGTKEFCKTCMHQKRVDNGEYILEAMWARPYRHQ